jgi:hypothetical protein
VGGGRIFSRQVVRGRGLRLKVTDLVGALSQNLIFSRLIVSPWMDVAKAVSASVKGRPQADRIKSVHIKTNRMAAEWPATERCATGRAVN